ncbi:MAG TPA: family 43 glycosylhydrolase [Pyrinomonadaceae bacterium]
MLKRRPGGVRLGGAHLVVAFAVSLLILCLHVGVLAQTRGDERAVYTNPVIAGDFPDPSVIRVGTDYWAMTTTGTWAPHFPILHSRDLVNWRVVGYVFEKSPAWVKSDFWAPEITHDRGRFLVYYTARREEGRGKTGTLCVAVASAKSPVGPYTDHGALVCEIPELKNVGSIDGFFIRDEKNVPYLIWKADGNDAEPDVPTSIFAQRLTEDGTRLVGKRKEILRNDAAWERHVVEGSFILKRGRWFYHFYSGNACCGRGCDYALGVARSRRLLGKWEKSPKNPIVDDNSDWQCPGHGSIVSTPDGRDFLLYHSYRRRRDTFNVGREALLDEIRWNADGWPEINAGRGPTSLAASPHGIDEADDEAEFFDDFKEPRLGLEWQWPMFFEQTLRVDTATGHLVLESSRSGLMDEWTAAVAARRILSGNYVATTLVSLARDARASSSEARATAPDARAASTPSFSMRAGLSAYSWRDRSIGIAVGRGKVSVWRREGRETRTLAVEDAPAGARSVYLRMTAKDGELYRFAYSADGRDWKELGEAVDGSFIEGAHVALTAGGAPGSPARFDWFRLSPNR